MNVSDVCCNQWCTQDINKVNLFISAWLFSIAEAVSLVVVSTQYTYTFFWNYVLWLDIHACDWQQLNRVNFIFKTKKIHIYNKEKSSSKHRKVVSKTDTSNVKPNVVFTYFSFFFSKVWTFFSMSICLILTVIFHHMMFNFALNCHSGNATLVCDGWKAWREAAPAL